MAPGSPTCTLMFCRLPSRRITRSTGVPIGVAVTIETRPLPSRTGLPFTETMMVGSLDAGLL